MLKKNYIAVLLLSGISALCFTNTKMPAREKRVTAGIIKQADSFFNFTAHVFLPAVQHNAGAKKLRALFIQARLLYKKFEWAAEYFTPAAARLINGAPVPSFDGGMITTPQGLQVAETMIYPVWDATQKQALVQQLKLICNARDELLAYFKNIDILDWQVFDAVKLEVFRIEILGIAGFDAPLAKNSMAEAACSINSMQQVIKLYSNTAVVNTVFCNAGQYLEQHPSFDSFDRAAFIKIYADPITSAVTILANTMHIKGVQYSRLLRQDATTLFDTGAFDVTAYAPGIPYSPSSRQILLGEKLFNDPVLSGSGNRSCAFCHDPAKNFTDGLVKNISVDGRTILPRNTPTLLNAALQPFQFYDMRVTTLEAQVTDVVQSHTEMNGSLDSAAVRLWRNNTYRQLFAEAFSQNGRSGIDTFEITHAIAEYIRSLSKLNSRFDRYMRGDLKALNNSEVAGFNLFMGKAKCGTCHFMPLFNGVIPPSYTNEEPEVIGVPADLDSKAIDTDTGVYKIIKAPFYLHAFKTPTLRNTAHTAPYMHNGAFAALKDVLNFYNAGGGTGRGINVSNQTLAKDSLRLSNTDIDNIIAFINSLSSN
ncbi:MAG TPA: cytochrome c peroxidase [Chitinophagaceae bacterium]|nr:cytochrome c peroxidase [Chitinophagaceae bacterium]